MHSSRIMIDLHGYSVKDAKAVLEKQFAQIIERNIVEFYIITGRGNHPAADGQRGILKKILPKLLKPYCEDILEIDQAMGSYRIRLKKLQQNTEADRNNLKKLLQFFIGDDKKLHHDLLKRIQEKADEGDLDSLILLAGFYLNGIIEGFQDVEKAIKLLNQAKEMGSLDAYVLLGSFYLEGEYVKANYKKAVNLLKYAAEKNSPEGQFWYGKSFLHGQGVKHDSKQAVQWLQRSADQGFISAQASLGYTYFTGDWSIQDEKLAFKYLSLASQQLHPQATALLARCYACGYGTAIDFAIAFSLYLQAAKYDDVYSLYQVGKYYQDGRSGEKNGGKAFPYFMKAALLGDADAQAKIAEAFLFGECDQSIDIPKGMEWLRKSLAQKNGYAYYLMAQVYKRGTGVDKNIAEELKFLELSAKAEFTPAQFEWGLELLVGKLVKLNEEEGWYFIKKAAEDEEPRAKELLNHYFGNVKGDKIVAPKEKEGNASLVETGLFKVTPGAAQPAETSFPGIKKGFFG